MELSNLVGTWSVLMSTLQGIGAFYGLVDRSQKKEMEKGGAPLLNRFNPLAISVLLFIGTVVTIAFAAWMFFAKPLRPKIQTAEKTVYVDKYLPCPPEKTGNATTHGAQAPASSGNGNTVNYGQQPPAKQP